MEFDRTLLTERYLINVIKCIEDHGLDLDDFEFSTQQTNSYEKGKLNPKAVVYVCRLSTGIEMTYLLSEELNFSDVFCQDLNMGVYDKG